MQGENDLSPDVISFVEDRIGSVEHLEILRLLGEDAEKEWHAAELARQSQVSAGALTDHLAILESRGLLKMRTVGPDVLCRLDPQPAAVAVALGKLLQVYKERPVTLINLLYARRARRDRP